MISTAPDSELCFCDSRGLGATGVSCGDCPTKDYMSEAKTTAARQRAYKARKQAQGLVRVSEWVHKDDAAAMRDLAGRARKSREGRADFLAWLASASRGK